MPMRIRTCARCLRLGRQQHRRSQRITFTMAAANSNDGVAKPSADSKQRVLCLHGYLQNAEVFRAKAGSLRKGLKSRCELSFVDAPHLVSVSAQDVSEVAGSQEQPRGWWTWKDTEPGMRPSLASSYAGWEESLAVLVAEIERIRPDAILGFSQGATATALLLAHLRSQPELQYLLPRYAILIAGFLPRDEHFADLLRAHPPALPLLLVHGQADRLVPVERSLQLQAALETGGRTPVQRHEHPGAHMVPSCSGDFKRLLQGFIDANTQPPA